MLAADRLRVCFIAGTLGRGGAERQLIHMLRALKSIDVSSRVLSLTSGEALEDEIRSLGITVERVCEKQRSRVGKLMRIVNSLRREPAEILQGVHFYTNLYAAAAARLTGHKEIGAIRSNLNFDLEANGAWGKLQLHSPRHLITNSSPSEQLAIAKGVSPARIHLVPNVVDVDPEVRDCSKTNGVVRILFVGRLTEEKRADRFLRVVSSVIKRAPQLYVEATVVGAGPERPRIEDLARKLGFNGNLHLLGEREDMTSLYRNSDLLVLTSDMEGTPNVLLEAMAHGLPVAATQVGGVPEVVRADRGFLADPQDEEAMVAAVLRLVLDPNLRVRLGRAGQQYVSRCHSMNSLSDRLMGIYREVLAQ